MKTTKHNLGNINKIKEIELGKNKNAQDPNEVEKEKVNVKTESTNTQNPQEIVNSHNKVGYGKFSKLIDNMNDCNKNDQDPNKEEEMENSENRTENSENRSTPSPHINTTVMGKTKANNGMFRKLIGNAEEEDKCSRS